MDQIIDYATLQSAVAGTLHRPSDPSITANLPLWIQLCEAELNDRLLLKNMESEEPLTLATGNNYVALPAGYISPIELWLVISNVRRPLDPVAPEDLPYSPSNSIPQYWAIDGANIRFDCPASSAYSAKFRMVKASNLSVSSPTNYLLLKRPDVYLWGTLKQSALFTEVVTDAAALQKWSGLYEQAIRGLKAAESRNRSIVPLRTDLNRSRRSTILTG